MLIPRVLDRVALREQIDPMCTRVAGNASAERNTLRVGRSNDVRPGGSSLDVCVGGRMASGRQPAASLKYTPYETSCLSWP